MLKYYLVFLMICVGITIQAQDKTIYLSLDEALKNPDLVYRLDLSHQGLTKIPKSINQLKYLKRLDLSYNNLSDISPILDSLKDLRHLHLNNNQIKELPSRLFQLTKLKRLYLSDNQIKNLSEDIKNLKKLKHLDVTNNKITKLPEEIWELEKINVIRFDDPLFLKFETPFLPNQYPIFNWITMSRPDSIDGKPLSFYLNHADIDPYSKLYVQGKYALDQDRAACVFIDSIFTKNPETAMFYAYLYAETVDNSSDEFPLFELMHSKRMAFLIEQPCLFMAYYQDYLKWVYEMDEGILDESSHQKIISRLKNNCSFHFDNEVDLYFNYLNFFLPQSERKGQIGVRVNDTLETIEYICLYDSKGKKIGNSYDDDYHSGKKWFESLLSDTYTLVFYTEKGYEERNKKDENAMFLVDSINIVMSKEVVLESIHKSLFIEIGARKEIVQTDVSLPPPPPPPSPPVEVSYVSEYIEVVEVIDEETGEIIEVYVEEEFKIDSNEVKRQQAYKDSCYNLFYPKRAEKLQFFLDEVYNPATKKSNTSKETLAFLTEIKEYLNGELNSRYEHPNLLNFPLIPSYLVVNDEVSMVLDMKEDWSGKPLPLPSRHERIIRKNVQLYYSNSSIKKTYTMNKYNKYYNGCETWVNYPLHQNKDSLLPAFCSQYELQLNYGKNELVDELLDGKNTCDNIWKGCRTDENQETFATLKEVPNLYFTRSKNPYLPARGVYLKVKDKIVELWYHEMESELCGCDH